MPYHHRVNTHHKQKRANRTKKISKYTLLLIFIGMLAIGVDWLLTELRPKETQVSTINNSTVQAARINIFQTPYFKFEADSKWREVTDQFDNPEGNYIYRKYDNELIEHELWVTVGEKDFSIERHYPTRVLPVRIESSGRLTELGPVSERCEEAVKDGNLDPRNIKQLQIQYFCHPNSRDYTVTVGVPGSTNSLLFPGDNDEESPITIIYKNVTAYPDARELVKIINKFSSQPL